MAGIPVLSDLDLQSLARILNLLDPTLPQHPATKAYVDAALEGLAWKADVRVATQSNISIAAPGATIDGQTMAAGDRMLVMSQTTASENGLYVWNAAATPATRTYDCALSKDFNNAIVTVLQGTSVDTTYRQTAINPTVGTTAIAWETFGVSAPAATTSIAGIAALATQAEVDAGTVNNKIVTPLTLASWASRIKKFSSTFGDGAATQYDITHNLNSLDVHVQVVRVSDGQTVDCQQTRTGVNVTRLNFASAPATNALRCVVVG